MVQHSMQSLSTDRKMAVYRDFLFFVLVPAEYMNEHLEFVLWPLLLLSVPDTICY